MPNFDQEFTWQNKTTKKVVSMTLNTPAPRAREITTKV